MCKFCDDAQGVYQLGKPAIIREFNESGYVLGIFTEIGIAQGNLVFHPWGDRQRHLY